MRTFLSSMLLALVFATSAFAMGEEPKPTMAEAVADNIRSQISYQWDEPEVQSFKSRIPQAATVTDCYRARDWVNSQERVLTTEITCTKIGSRDVIKLLAVVAYFPEEGTITNEKEWCTPTEVLTQKKAYIKLEKTCNVLGKPMTLTAQLFALK